ncbi:21589_t:CDS:2, partial [Gigaspora rosea]
NSASSRVSGSLVTSAEFDIKEMPTSVEFDEEIITLVEFNKEIIPSVEFNVKIIPSVEFDKEITTSTESDEEEIQIFAECNMEEMSEILGVEISAWTLAN